MALVMSSTAVDCSAVVLVLVLVLALVGRLAAQEWVGGAAIVAPCEMDDGGRGWKASALPAIASRSEAVARVDGNLMMVYLDCVT